VGRSANHSISGNLSVVKVFHEIRDPIHTFVRLDSEERKVLNSRPFQRLRYIHQLGMTYLVYPAATHKRFEHTLGVMELATRVFDVVTDSRNVGPGVEEWLPELKKKDDLMYWRRVLRMAALCHDLGHLPFSHVAEHYLLPQGWDHERLSAEIIRSEELQDIWNAMTPPLRCEDIVKIVLGPRKYEKPLTPWETILSEIITGDAFGVDRIDYLLRDSHHLGVAYGRFDHHRLIDTMRILSVPEQEGRPALGVEEGGLHSAEALLLARYFMYRQVYMHPVRRIYDIHLRDFLAGWLRQLGHVDGKFPTDLAKFLQLIDDQVITELHKAAFEQGLPYHDPARRIVRRDHYKLFYQQHPDDIQANPDACQIIFQAALQKYGEANVRRDQYVQKREPIIFPVLSGDNILDATKISEVLQHLPIVNIDYLFVRPDLVNEAIRWANQERKTL
jgi:HD superfamily phosphohydrolase